MGVHSSATAELQCELTISGIYLKINSNKIDKEEHQEQPGRKKKFNPLSGPNPLDPNGLPSTGEVVALQVLRRRLRTPLEHLRQWGAPSRAKGNRGVGRCFLGVFSIKFLGFSPVFGFFLEFFGVFWGFSIYT